ncbi:DUF5675 family protein [bacterium]|jgi:hypothetical protein|nr:DUF5675 family protein [bacterium]
MKEIILERIFNGSDYTIGKLYIDDKYFCDTLENVIRNTDIKEHYKSTAIPYGRYKIIMNLSKKFKKIIPQLIDVEGFNDIRIHSGNFSTDTESGILTGKNTQKAQLTNSNLWTSLVCTKINEYIDNNFEVYIIIK